MDDEAIDELEDVQYAWTGYLWHRNQTAQARQFFVEACRTAHQARHTQAEIASHTLNEEGNALSRQRIAQLLSEDEIPSP